MCLLIKQVAVPAELRLVTWRHGVPADKQLAVPAEPRLVTWRCHTVGVVELLLALHACVQRTQKCRSVRQFVQVAGVEIFNTSEGADIAACEQGKWASHVSYSNDVMLVDEKTNNPVEYMSGKPVAELPDTAPY